MNNGLMFSSKSEIWATPTGLYNSLHKIHNFHLDACAIPENAKCERFITPEQDGLKTIWDVRKDESVWCNPPYGRGIGEWVKRGYWHSLIGIKVVMLLPARVDTKWFHDYCVKGKVEFLKGRLKFNDHVNNAPFPSMIVVFEPKTNAADISGQNKPGYPADEYKVAFYFFPDLFLSKVALVSVSPFFIEATSFFMSGLETAFFLSGRD